MPVDKRDAALDLRLMSCQAGGRSYYLDASAVRSVHRKEEWKLNWRSETPLGWIRYRGAEIPILDLARALGVSHTTVAENAVVVETEQGPKAWGVGGVGRVLTMAGERILPVPEACVSENSPPWLGVVLGESNHALCLSPQHLGSDTFLEPMTAVKAAPSDLQARLLKDGKATGRALLFNAYDGRGRLPEVRFCLGLAQIAEFVTAPWIVPVPAGRPWLIGVMVWRGRSVPLINLGWGVTGKTTMVETEDYLIVRSAGDESLAAVTVFGKPDPVGLPFECEQEPEPRVNSPEWFRGSFKHKHQLFLTPDFGLILKS